MVTLDLYTEITIHRLLTKNTPPWARFFYSNNFFSGKADLYCQGKQFSATSFFSEKLNSSVQWDLFLIHPLVETLLLLLGLHIQ